MRAPWAWPAALMALLMVCPCLLVRAKGCRKTPKAESQWCGLPQQLANYQGNFACEKPVRVGRPANTSELLTLVGQFSRVKAVGVGHSWWGEQFCSGSDNSSINIVMTELTDTLALIKSPPLQADLDPKFPIQVNEGQRTVTVNAGVPTRVLLDYLQQYRSKQNTEGWTLGMFPWFIDQTIGGAVSTGTHGSSMKYKSLSSQVVGLEMVLANGTLATYSASSTPPHLWHALQLSVGRLGIITKVQLAIVPNIQVYRSLQQMSTQQLIDQIKDTQDKYVQALDAVSSDAISDALKELDETQAFWYVQTGQAWRIDYTHLEPQGYAVNDPAWTTTNARSHADSVDAASVNGSEEEGLSYAQAVQAAQPANQALLVDPRLWGATFGRAIQALVQDGTYPARDAYLSEDATSSRVMQDLDPYDQYELSVDLKQAGDCLQLISDAIQEKHLGTGFRIPGLIRFVGLELPFLSNANGSPRMFVNIEDHVSRQTGQENVPFQQVVQMFREKCGARLHWGKAGWPRYAPCFDGAQEYNSSWCHFGCAVHELDPNGKFASASNVWAWHASKNGHSIPFASCCSSTGFDGACTCAQRPSCSV